MLGDMFLDSDRHAEHALLYCACPSDGHMHEDTCWGKAPRWVARTSYHVMSYG